MPKVKRLRNLKILLPSVLLAVSCADSPDEANVSFPTQVKSSLGLAEPSQRCKNQLSLTNKSLFFNKTNILRDRFSLERVIDQIIQTSGSNVTEGQLPSFRTRLIQSFTQSFATTQMTNTGSNLKIPVDARFPEESMSVEDF